MGRPLQISDELVLRAREEAERSERTITEQIEHWARLGLAVEALLSHAEVAALERRGRALTLPQAHALVHSSEGRESARKHLAATMGPLYAADPEQPDSIVRVGVDGTRTPGRMVERVFVPDADAKR
jgi:hypothetical protein